MQQKDSEILQGKKIQSAKAFSPPTFHLWLKQTDLWPQHRDKRVLKPITNKRDAEARRTDAKADAHLCAAHADDAVDAAAGIVEEGHGDGVLAGRQPVAFGGRVDLKDMGFGTVDGLLPLKTHKNNKSQQVSDAHIQQIMVSYETEWTQLISVHKLRRPSFL